MVISCQLACSEICWTGFMTCQKLISTNPMGSAQKLKAVAKLLSHVACRLTSDISPILIFDSSQTWLMTRSGPHCHLDFIFNVCCQCWEFCMPMQRACNLHVSNVICFNLQHSAIAVFPSADRHWQGEKTWTSPEF